VCKEADQANDLQLVLPKSFEKVDALLEESEDL